MPWCMQRQPSLKSVTIDIQGQHKKLSHTFHSLDARISPFLQAAGEKKVVPVFSLPSHAHLTTKCMRRCRLLAKWIAWKYWTVRQPMTGPSTASAVLLPPLILTQRMCPGTSLLSHWGSVLEKSPFIQSKNFPPLPCRPFPNILHSSMTVTPCYPRLSCTTPNFPKCQMQWRCDNKHWHHLQVIFFLSRREDTVRNRKGFLFILKAHANKNRITVQLHWVTNCVSIFLQAAYVLNIK